MFIEQIFGTVRPDYDSLINFLKISGEDSRIEFKREVSSDIDKNLLMVTVAFANSEGGLLFIGITDKNREIVGSKGTSEGFESIILDRIEPSMSGLFFIEEVALPQGGRVFIIEVEQSPQIHALRMRTNKEKVRVQSYSYYYRSAKSTRLMTPAIINRISSIKADLKYNYNFRVSIFLKINKLLKEIVWGINVWREIQIDQEGILKLSREYLRVYSYYKKAVEHDFVKLMRSIRLELHYNEFWREITLFYKELLEIEMDIPHTNLTFEEDMNLKILKRVLNEGLNIVEKETDYKHVSNLVFIGLDNKVFYDYNLSLFSARGLFAYVLDYLTPQGYEKKEAREKLRTFDYFINRRKNFGWPPFYGPSYEWLTIDDIEKLMKEYLYLYPEHDDYGVFEKAEVRRNQYLYYSTKTFSTLILKLFELREHLYINLSLPIPITAQDDEYEKYLRTLKTSFIYPAHKGLQ